MNYCKPSKIKERDSYTEQDKSKKAYSFNHSHSYHHYKTKQRNQKKTTQIPEIVRHWMKEKGETTKIREEM